VIGARGQRDVFGRVGVVVLVLLYGVPLVYLIATSLKNRVQIFDAPASLLFHPTFSSYESVISSDLARAAANTAIIAFGTTALILVLGTPAAYWLSRNRSFLATVAVASLILLQMVPQATTVIPLFKVMALFGLIGQLLSVILADASLLLPFAVILLRPFFDAVPAELEEAASIDGASRFRVLTRIALPLVRNGLLTVGTLVWIIAWGEFLYAITFLTEEERLPLSALLARQISQFGTDWGPLMALAVLIALPVLVVFVLTERRLREGLVLGAER